MDRFEDSLDNVELEHCRFLPKIRTQWKWIENQSSDALAKKPGLQGPIDDAFMSPFLFVPPNSTNPQTLSDRWIADEYRHATKEWRRHFRGDIRSKPAEEVSDEDIASCNLILFGTPKTNPLIAKMASSLPVKWSDEQVQLGHNPSTRRITSRP